MAQNAAARILERCHSRSSDTLIQTLIELQHVYGYLPKEDFYMVADFFRMSVSELFSIASFYNEFRFQKVGKYHLCLCRGVSCFNKDSFAILQALEKEFGVEIGKTTPDGLLSIDTVSCLGACGKSPSMSVNGTVYSELSPGKALDLIRSLLKDEDANEQ